MQTKSGRQEKTKRSSAKSSEPAAPARPRQRDVKRAGIVAAAREAFFAQGYAGASMDQITARSGVSKATVYAYFGSKDELLLAVVDDVIQGVRSAMAAELPDDEDFRAWLTEVGKLGFRQLMSPAAIALQRIAIAEANRFPEIAQALRQAGADTVLATAVMPAFEAAVARNILRTCDPGLAISHFFEMCTAKALRDVLMGLSPPPGAREVEAQVRCSVEAFLDGYAQR